MSNLIHSGIVVFILLFRVFFVESASPKTLAVTRTVGIDCASISLCIYVSGTGDTVFIPSGVYTESLSIDKAVTLTGANPLSTIIRAVPSSRVIGVGLNGVATIQNLTLTGGNTSNGAGIGNWGVLTLTNAIVFSNTDGGGIENWGPGVISNSVILDNIGGGIKNFSSLAIRNSTVSGNQAGSGGGIYNSGYLNIQNSTISKNSALNDDGFGNSGGGIYNSREIFIVNTTISNNSGTAKGGGIANINFEMMGFYSKITLNHVTLANNIISSGFGGGIASTGELTLSNSLISGNILGDCWSTGSLNQGNNWIADNSCNPIKTGDPKIGGLSNNGGLKTASGVPPLTIPLLPGSPAIDGVACITGISSDERGYVRPKDGNGDGISSCDYGAYEAQWRVWYLPHTIRDQAMSW